MNHILSWRGDLVIFACKLKLRHGKTNYSKTDRRERITTIIDSRILKVIVDDML